MQYNTSWDLVVCLFVCFLSNQECENQERPKLRLQRPCKLKLQYHFLCIYILNMITYHVSLRITLSEAYVYVQGLKVKERTIERESIPSEMGFRRVRFYSQFWWYLALYAIRQQLECFPFFLWFKGGFFPMQLLLWQKRGLKRYAGHFP